MMVSYYCNIGFVHKKRAGMATTILVVEDEPAIQELISLNLEQAGYRSLRATDAEQAIEMVRDELPDLVLLDWMLPGMSGIEFARRLRADRRELPCRPASPRRLAENAPA